uniref:Uncharacterized protein n=1 Tax=Cacopsylla melanoneura TaxID=428564 RepID=A0A8D8XFV9_9HEMI
MNKYLTIFFLYFSPLKSSGRRGRFFTACGRTIRPILTKSIVLCVLSRGNFNTKFQASSSFFYRLIWLSKSGYVLCRKNTFFVVVILYFTFFLFILNVYYIFILFILNEI